MKVRDIIDLIIPPKPPEPEASYMGRHLFTSFGPGVEPFDGEKNEGEIGRVMKSAPHHEWLRIRSWDYYLKSEIAQLIIQKFGLWTIGSGLKLQADPGEEVLSSEGVNLSEDEFSRKVETRFAVYANSKFADYSQKGNLNTVAKEAFKHAKIGGDVLVILRVKKGLVNAQLVDGAHICNPQFDEQKIAEERGNRIVHGVEIDDKGRHVAFYVKTGLQSWERVAAEVQGLKRAYLVTGLTYRSDDQRGIPLISAILETIAKLDRYKEATVGSAEERQKIAYYIYHELGSTGENPIGNRIAKSLGREPAAGGDGNDLEHVRENIEETTQKQVFNMPNGSRLSQLESKNELYFEDFYRSNLRIISATAGIPMEVALDWYDSNYSASRAAIKSWEHALMVEREAFATQFYKPFYDLWLEVEILKNKIEAPGYIAARQNDNHYVLEAYRFARFRGANVPHIDPYKEVQAERLKLGNEKVPLTTVEKATENLNGGDSKANMNQFRREMQEAKDLNVEDGNSG